MSSMLLPNLKAQRDEQRKIISEATALLRDLDTAIAALEQEPASQVEAQKTIRVGHKRRGEQMHVALEAIRAGKGRPHEIRDALAEAGYEITPNTVSNVIQRLHRKAAIRADVATGGYVPIPKGESPYQTMDALRASVEMLEGSKVVALKPSQNGGPASTVLGGV